MRIKRKMKFYTVFSLFYILHSTFYISSAQQDVPTEAEEYALKAAFLYNFTKYIDWQPDDSEEFIIGVVGSSPLVKPITDIARTKTVKGKKIVIRQFSRASD